MEHKRIYLVDTENIGSEWLDLLRKSEDCDSFILFISNRTAKVSYYEAEELFRYKDRYQLIRCKTGTNAMDFQLVTYLGYLVHDDAETEYFIVSKDTGFDCVVAFWTDRERKVIRIPDYANRKLKYFDPAAAFTAPRPAVADSEEAAPEEETAAGEESITAEENADDFDETAETEQVSDDVLEETGSAADMDNETFYGDSTEEQPVPDEDTAYSVPEEQTSDDVPFSEDVCSTDTASDMDANAEMMTDMPETAVQEQNGPAETENAAAEPEKASGEAAPAAEIPDAEAGKKKPGKRSPRRRQGKKTSGAAQNTEVQEAAAENASDGDLAPEGQPAKKTESARRKSSQRAAKTAAPKTAAAAVPAPTADISDILSQYSECRLQLIYRDIVKKFGQENGRVLYNDMKSSIRSYYSSRK